MRSCRTRPFPPPTAGRRRYPGGEHHDGDSGALFLLVLWLPLLVVAAVGLVWLQERWGRWQTWLVGAPVILAALWGVSQTAVQLLPNVM